MKIDLVPVGFLRHAEYNPRKVSPEDFEQIRLSLERFGFVEPIVVNSCGERDGIIIGGNQRFEVAKNMGLKEVPVHYVSIENIEREKELNVRLNRNQGEWDFESLKLNFTEEALLEYGFQNFEIETEPEEEIPGGGEPPAAEKTARAELGKVYTLGRHRLMCGDASSKEDFDLLLEGKMIDLIFTDPPYGIDYEGVSHKFEKIKNDDKNPTALVACVLRLAPQLKSLYVCCNWQSLAPMVEAMEQCDFKVKSCIVWDKKRRVQNLDLFAKRHEFILYAGPFGGERTLDDDIWAIDRPVSEDHPTSKPLELCGRAIRYSSKKGALVYDPFGGSGSTLIACEKIHRSCYSMELDPIYVDVIIKRWCDLTKTDPEGVYAEAA